MESRLLQLATLSHALKLKPSLHDSASRQLFHAAVYLAQNLGLELGYTFSWHEHGPYSARLTSDLYDLAAGPERASPYPLNSEFSGRVRKIERLFHVPSGIGLSSSKWLILLAATHYLSRYFGLGHDEVKRRVALIDSALPPYYEEATAALTAA